MYFLVFSYNKRNIASKVLLNTTKLTTEVVQYFFDISCQTSNIIKINQKDKEKTTPRLNEM